MHQRMSPLVVETFMLAQAGLLVATKLVGLEQRRRLDAGHHVGLGGHEHWEHSGQDKGGRY